MSIHQSVISGSQPAVLRAYSRRAPGAIQGATCKANAYPLYHHSGPSPISLEDLSFLLLQLFPNMFLYQTLILLLTPLLSSGMIPVKGPVLVFLVLIPWGSCYSPTMRLYNLHARQIILCLFLSRCLHTDDTFQIQPSNRNCMAPSLLRGE